MKQQYSVSTFMAATLLFLLFLSLLHTASAQQNYTNITLGSSLTPTTNSSWRSRSGLYAFGFYWRPQGYYVGVFLAGAPDKTVVWTANRDEPPVPENVTLAFTDGRLVLQLPQSQNTYIIDGSQPASVASMLDSGNFVLYNSTWGILWQSFDHPTDTIVAGQPLSAGKELVSSASETNPLSGSFRMKMQHDGHLVQFPVNTPDETPYAYYWSGTEGAGDGCTLNLENNGHLYLLNAMGTNIKTLTDGESAREEMIYIMRIDVDGIFRVYSRTLDRTGNWSIKWASTADKCDPKGLCGLNGFCAPKDDEAECKCLPGFDFVDPGNWTAGCSRNFVADTCKNGSGGVEITMRSLENTIWEDVSYSVFESATKEDCEKECLQDCNCEAALYEEGGNCRKQRLPMRYGRRSLNDQQIAFIKVAGRLASAKPKKELRVDMLIISGSLIAFAFMVLAVSGVLIYRNQARAYKIISATGNIELVEDVALRSFTFAELVKVTNGFDQELGRGAFGTVYKGIIPFSQKVVAVKKLEKVLTEGEREFQTEIKAIGRTHHRNLVQLIGYCLEGPNRLLVYEYMCNGSLADLLFTPERKPSWDERIRIALDIARGILYLHEECETQIIHCDIKPQNILMDEHGCAKISDFGLAKLLKPDQTKTFTGIRGTKGYVAPEWHSRLPVTNKADVYSFGIMLLEIVCGRKCLDWSLSEEQAVLEEWVYDCFAARELNKLVADEEMDERKLERMVKVGLWCIQNEPSLRPSMKKVMLMLEGTVDIPVPPGPTSFLSAI